MNFSESLGYICSEVQWIERQARASARERKCRLSLDDGAKEHSSTVREAQNQLGLWYGSVNVNGIRFAPIDESIASLDGEKDRKRQTKAHDRM